MKTVEKATGLALLREPFPANQISYLPKGGVKLAYVGHAALTDRLLDADPAWNWEFAAVNPDGTPIIDKEGGFWIKLTVCGVTRLGYGDAQGKTGGNAMKERIGDALRNAAMRFGAALDLWHKGELHIEEVEPVTPSCIDADKIANITALADEVKADMPKLLAYFKVDALEKIQMLQYPQVIHALEKKRVAA